MRKETAKLPVLRVAEHEKCETEDIVVKEFSFTIVINGQELITLLCSPTKLDYLAVGFLLSQGLIEKKDDIRKIVVNEHDGIAQIELGRTIDVSGKPVLASGGGRSFDLFDVKRVSTDLKARIHVSQIFSLVEHFVQHSKVFKVTGGVHSAALCNTNGILVFSEDIGRHNAIDKIFGECLLKDITLSNCFIITSGRVSSEIVLKVARRDIPLLVSKSAPTDVGIKLAKDLGVTLIGFARDKRMNIYANDWRITVDG